MRQAFTLFELMISIVLAGAMVIFAVSFLDTSTLSKENIKSQLQSHFSLISAASFQCKELSGAMPVENNTTLANGTLVSSLECNTSTPYQLDGGKGIFIPPAISGFTDYNATQNGTEFYFSTSTTINSTNDNALKDLNSSYSTNQYVLSYDATTATLKFYLSR